jgi:hypothetical protein
LVTRYLEILFRSKYRLIVLVVLLPVVFSAVDAYLWRSYNTNEAVFVDDPGVFGQGTASALGFDPYSTPAQNFARLFSNLVGTQTFNFAVADELANHGIIHTSAERAALVASLSQLTVSPGQVSSGGSGGSSASAAGGNGDHLITISYVCKREYVCQSVLSAALDVFRIQYSNLKARASATARAIYEANLKVGLADVAAATAAIQKYIASLPKTSSHNVQTVQDPQLTELQHEQEVAQKEVDTANSQILGVDNITKVSAGMANDLSVVDGPKTLPGLYGIKGLGSDNLKSDAIAFGACLFAAAAYVILVAFLDRTVRDPHQIKARLGKTVVTIPEYQTQKKIPRARAKASSAA